MQHLDEMEIEKEEKEKELLICSEYLRRKKEEEEQRNIGFVRAIRAQSRGKEKDSHRHAHNVFMYVNDAVWHFKMVRNHSFMLYGSAVLLCSYRQGIKKSYRECFVFCLFYN